MKALLFFLPALAVGIAIPLLVINQTRTYELTPPRTTPPLHTRFSLADAPADSLRATITKLSGDVTWQSRTATEAAPLTASRILQQGEILTTGSGGTASLTFAGSCLITLSPDTELNLTQTLPANIVLEIPNGRITSEKKCPEPISIRSMHLLLSQIEGTLQFTALDDGTIIIGVTDGSAQVGFNDSDNVSTVLTINAGESLTYDDSTRTTDLK